MESCDTTHDNYRYAIMHTIVGAGSLAFQGAGATQARGRGGGARGAGGAGRGDATDGGNCYTSRGVHLW